MGFVQIHREKETATVVLKTDLVASTAFELRPRLRDLVKEGVTTIHIQMGEVKKIDSHGISLLVATTNSLHPNRGELTLTGVRPPICHFFQTLQLTKRFKVNPE